jgi:hypothetical protein
MPRTASLPLWLVSLGPVLGAGVALLDCAVPPGHQSDGVPVGSPTDCYACHQADYEGAHNPMHPGNMPTSCADCHESSAWRPARFPTHTPPLEGAHVRATCASCHGDPADYVGIATECYACHQADYERSAFPGHQTFQQTCQDCHSQDAWAPALNAGGSHDIFPLEGAHARATCIQCHGDPPVYGGQPHECVGCHRADYDGATFAGHSGFATTCQDCHTVEAWTPANFPHDRFPLDGAHAAVSCVSCHGDPPDYVNTPTDCVGCHRADYDASPYPGHSNFSTTCTDCHTTTAWRPATGGTHPEAAFPIASGRHSGIACGDCHNEGLSASYADNIDCIGCHAHSRATADAQHGDAGGYQWSSSDHDFCRNCHSTGRAGD